MATVQDVIKRSLRIIGAIDALEAPTSKENSDAMDVLNSLIDSWRNTSLMVYSFKDIVTALQAGKSGYTIGPGGDIDDIRPVRLHAARLTLNDVDYEMDVITVDGYNDIPAKQTESTLPGLLYYMPSFPLGTIKISQVPSQDVALTLTVWTPLEEYSSFVADLNLPPGYRRMMEYCLADELASEYGKVMPPDALMKKAEAVAQVKRTNMAAMPMDMALNFADGRVFDWRTGD